jgi:hypothetical protein
MVAWVFIIVNTHHHTVILNEVYSLSEESPKIEKKKTMEILRFVPQMQDSLRMTVQSKWKNYHPRTDYVSTPP